MAFFGFSFLCVILVALLCVCFLPHFEATIESEYSHSSESFCSFCAQTANKISSKQFFMFFCFVCNSFIWSTPTCFLAHTYSVVSRSDFIVSYLKFEMQFDSAIFMFGMIFNKYRICGERWMESTWVTITLQHLVYLSTMFYINTVTIILLSFQRNEFFLI